MLHRGKTHALYDHFWLNSKRMLWHETADEPKYPSRNRSMEKPGGFMWQFKYTITQGKELAWASFLDDTMKKAITELNDNEGVHTINP